MRTCLIACLLLAAAPFSSYAQDNELLADDNLDGKVTQPEFEKSRMQFFMRGDYDKDGRISQAEWNKGAERLRNYVRAEDVDGWDLIGKGQLFITLDASGDGYVSPDEIDSYSLKRFALYDLNHDGYITLRESEQLQKSAGRS